MPNKKTSLNHSLLLRGNVWHIHWNVPRSLRSRKVFRGKAIYSKTLKTRDVHEARKMRDLLVNELRQMAEESAIRESRNAFLSHYAEAKKAREEMQRQLPYLDEREAFNAVDALESAFNVEAVIENGDFTRADAYLAAIHDKTEVAEKYAITLKEAAWDFIKEHDGKLDKITLNRIKKATESLIKAIGDKDVQLKDVTPRQVTRWIDSIGSQLSDSTRRSYMVVLQKMWHWVWLNEHVDGDSPFKGTKITPRGDGTTYEPFTLQEVKALVKDADPYMLELMRYGLITGCRLGELTALSCDNFILWEGVHTLRIFDGKTKAAERSIPLPQSVWEAFKQCVKDGIWSTAHWSQKFGKLKMKATGNKDRTKVFHSFRHMTATAYEQEGTEERIVSVILGHKNKRGESMSYGLYSAGLAPRQYLEAVEQMLAGDYMSQFLKLFNK